MEMDGIQGACSDFIILKCSGHRLTLFAWCSAVFLLFLLLGDGDMMLSDKFMGQQYVSTAPSQHASLIPSGQMLRLRAVPPLNQTRHTPSTPPQTAKLQSSGRREEGGEVQGGYSSLCGGGGHPSISQWSASHP